MQDIEKLDDKKEKLGNKKIREILDNKKVRYINFIQWEIIDREEVKTENQKASQEKNSLILKKC